jgi:hypothetical protein
MDCGVIDSNGHRAALLDVSYQLYSHIRAKSTRTSPQYSAYNNLFTVQPRRPWHFITQLLVLVQRAKFSLLCVCRYKIQDSSLKTKFQGSRLFLSRMLHSSRLIS